jgi:DeoR/GlpR family transcriptional regulator of sugar metabolism
MAFVAPINAVNRLVTDEQSDPELIAALRERGIEVIIAQ